MIAIIQLLFIDFIEIFPTLLALYVLFDIVGNLLFGKR